MSEQLFADDFEAGQEFEGQTRRLGESAFAEFAALTGDAHPIHYDEDYAAQSRHGRRLAHGLLVAAMTALGATPLSFRLEAAMIALLEQGMRFRAPVFIEDEITTRFVVGGARLNHAKRTGVVTFEVLAFNQNRQKVAEGFHRYLLRMRLGAGGAVA